MRRTSNCLWQFLLTPMGVSPRSTMFHAEKCLKCGIFQVAARMEIIMNHIVEE